MNQNTHQIIIKQLTAGVWEVGYGEPERHTPVSLRKTEIRLNALNQLKNIEEPRLPFAWEALQIKEGGRGITITLPMDTSEDIYGFGLQLQSVNYAGRKRYVKVNSDPRMDTGESHAPAPFYVSTAGYGLFVDTFRYAAFYMGTNALKGASADKKEVNQPHKEFSESALYALKRAKEERRIIIEIPAARGIRLYLFAGDLKLAVQRYNLFSGGGCVPPMWGLGIWYRAYGGSDQAHVQRLAEEFRRDQIPVDVLGLEPGWQSHSYSCTYQWSKLFPRPQDLIAELGRKGYHVNLWEHAFVYPAATIYEELAPYSGNYEVWNGLVPDFATEEACRIFGDYHKKNLIDMGISGFKLDECDNSDYNPSNWSFPDSTEFPSGMDGEQMHNAIGVLYQQMLIKEFRRENQRTLSQVRSSGALSASLPFVLYSDLYSHKEFIRGMVTAPFSGMLWAPEVRDCKNPKDLLRRVETVCFSAHALLNCWRIPSPPWKQTDIEKNLSGEEMAEAEICTAACRKLFEIRMSLLPYLYSAFVEYYLYGVPPLCPVCIEYPEDIRARQLEDEYFFGESMLVCPLVLEDGTSRKVYLPEGKWYDYFTEETYQGGQEYMITADYDRIPVFVREGAVIPVAAPVQCVRDDTVFKIKVRHFGAKAGSFTLYEDDFVSWDYESKGFHKMNISVDENGEMKITGQEQCVKYSIVRE